MVTRPGRIEVRAALAEERADMLSFIAAHWRSDHIFVQRPEIFDWQYQKLGGDYNIVLAVDCDVTGPDRILGFLGYIPTTHYDPSIAAKEILLAIWKVRDDIVVPGIGIRLLKLVEKLEAPDMIGAIGISKMVEPIYAAFKYQLAALDQVALFPTKPYSGHIAAQVPTKAHQAKPQLPGWHLASIDNISFETIDALASAGPGLVKSTAYLRKRYLAHPWYVYTVMGVFEGDTLRSILVWRRVMAEGEAILRIVDIIGAPETLGQVTHALRGVLADTGASYFDLMCTGVDLAILSAAGFVGRQDYPDLILPNYFAPFVRENIVIKLSYKNRGVPPALYRADSDQDRPNHPTELAKPPEAP